MEEKDKYLALECVFTFLLLLIVILIFGEVLSGYRLYLTLGLIAGFCFSWFNRNRRVPLIRYFINIAVFGVFVRIIYSLLNSSFLYKEVIHIFVKGGISLEIILSFNSCFPPFLTYIQILSIPLFMCFSVFVKDYTVIYVILTLIYFICWVVILRIKFYALFKPQRLKKFTPFYPLFLSIAIFLIVFISWIPFYHFIFKKGGFFPSEIKGLKEEEAALEKEYYDMQDKIQKEITELIPELKAKEERYEALAFLSSLIKETPYMMELKKAEMGLIDYLKRPGPGLEKKDIQNLTFLLNNYLDKKVLLNLKRIKENIMDTLKINPFNVKEKFSILRQVNKIQYEKSYQKILLSEKKLQEIINKSSVDTSVKRDLKGLIKQFKEWKTFEIYRKASNSLKKKINSLDEQSKKEFQDFPLDVDEIEKLSDLENLHNKIKRLKETVRLELKDLLKEVEEILDLRLAMFFSEKTEESKEKIKNFNLPEDELRELEDDLDAVKEAENYKKFLEDFSKFKEKIQDAKIDIPQEIKELFKTKTYLFTKGKKEKIEDMLKENIPPDLKKEFLKNLEKLGLDEDIDKLTVEAKKMEKDVDWFLNQGFISEESRNNLIKELKDLRELFFVKFKVYREIKEKDKIPKETRQLNYQKAWEESLEKSSLSDDRKQTLKKLTDELSKVQTVSQLEDAKEAFEKEIESSLKEGVRKEEIEGLKVKFKELAQIRRMFIIDKALSDLIERIQELTKVSPEESKRIEDYLRNIRTSRTNEELAKNIESLKNYLKTKKLKEEEAREFKGKEVAEKKFLQIHILPSDLVIPVDSSASLKAIAIYSNMFIKELISDLEWFSSDPNIAWVDEKGTVHSLAKGKTRIIAKHKGTSSKEVEVTVIDKISEEIDKTIKKELAR